MLTPSSVKPKQCGICGVQNRVVFCESYNEYTLWECSECSGQFWAPMRAPNHEWYEKDERYSFRNKSPLVTPEHDHRIFLKHHPAQNGRLLDIGMGTGNFLAAARETGYDVCGIDFDRDAIEVAKNAFGLHNVYAADINDARGRFKEEAFDVVTLFQVLEHVENPRQFVETVRSLLKPGGYLALSVPYRDFWDTLKPGDKPPRHLSRWNEEAMRNFLKENGFEIVVTKKLPVPFKYLIKKFHFWTRGFLSFDLVNKMRKREAKKQENKETRKQRNKETKEQENKEFVLVQKLALAKDYVLFAIPALFLYAGLFLARKHNLDLLVIAQKKKF